MPLSRRLEASALLTIAGVGCAYLALLLQLNVPYMKLDPSGGGRSWLATAKFAGVYGLVWAAMAVCAVSLVPLVLLRWRRLAWALAAILVLGALGLEAAAMYRGAQFNRAAVSMTRLRDIGERLWKQAEDGNLDLPAQLPDDIASGELGRDGWGFPIWYRRLTPDHAYLVACGSDGTRQTQVPVASPGPFSWDTKHDIVYEIGGDDVAHEATWPHGHYSVYPDGPDQGEPCRLRCVFGCLMYW